MGEPGEAIGDRDVSGPVYPLPDRDWRNDHLRFNPPVIHEDQLAAEWAEMILNDERSRADHAEVVAAGLALLAK